MKERITEMYQAHQFLYVSSIADHLNACLIFSDVSAQRRGIWVEASVLILCRLMSCAQMDNGCTGISPRSVHDANLLPRGAIYDTRTLT
jgi:hypothetical protein